MSQDAALAPEPKLAVLREIATEVNHCKLCDLYKHALKGVPGEGDPNAEVLLIGEAPGWHENQQGRPFVGAAGQFLEQLLASVGLTRKDVFIANVVKHRPPDNRDPQPQELAACLPYLERQIEAIDPKVIVTLGRFSMNYFFPGEKISRIHGMARQHGNRFILCMYHPAAALHQGSLRAVVEDDFRRVTQVLAEARKLRASPPEAQTPAPSSQPAPQAKPPEPPKQLSLF
jgi:uracil-DNA glycosylase